MDGAIQYGHPGKKPPMWLNSIMNAEMEFFNGVMHGDPIPDEFKPLMTGEAARAAIAIPRTQLPFLCARTARSALKKL